MLLDFLMLLGDDASGMCRQGDSCLLCGVLAAVMFVAAGILPCMGVAVENCEDFFALSLVRTCALVLLFFLSLSLSRAQAGGRQTGTDTEPGRASQDL